MNFKKALDKAIRDIYVTAFKYHNYNQSAAARALGVARGTFISKMKKWKELK